VDWAVNGEERRSKDRFAEEGKFRGCLITDMDMPRFARVSDLIAKTEPAWLSRQSDRLAGALSSKDRTKGFGARS